MENSPTPLQESSPALWADVRLVATDMDGTLTDREQFVPQLLEALWALAAMPVATLIVTGRSTGWVQGLVAYLPVAGAIAENGGTFIPKGTGEPALLVELPPLDEHRRQLRAMFAQLQGAFPTLQPAADNRFRLTDWTFDLAGVTPADLVAIAAACETAGWGFTYSTVQGHIRPATQDKGIALQGVLQRHFPALSTQQVVTVGDSPNDAGLFDASRFPYSVGVANVGHYCDRLPHRPTFITQAPEIQGFTELTRLLLAAHPKGGAGAS